MPPPLFAQLLPPGPLAPLAHLVRARMSELPTRHDLSHCETVGLGLCLGQVVRVTGFEAVPLGKDIKAANLGLRSREGGLRHERLLSLILAHTRHKRRKVQNLQAGTITTTIG